MDATQTYKQRTSFLRDFAEITKIRLSVSVVFSSLAGYVLAADQVSSLTLLLLAMGGFFLVGASNAFNQIIERDLDGKMNRTRNRPLPTGRMTVNTAFAIASFFTLAGISILYVINPKTAMFGAISIFLYVSAYTPLKTKTPLSIFVGAIPGAIPFMLGWVAASGSFGIEPGTLFMIQFFWQFPHFWAIGWFCDKDYQKGGFLMLPTGKKDKSTAVQIVLYTLWTIIASLVPALGVTGDLHLSIPAAIGIGVLGGFLLWFAVDLYRKRTDTAARKLMLVSVLYISLLQIVYVVDKWMW